MGAASWIPEFQISLQTKSISQTSAAVRDVIVDTGPLVAYLDRGERHHHWAKDRIGALDPPLLVCEPVLVETMHLLARLPSAQQMLFKYLENGALKVAFRIEEHWAALRALHQKYRDQPMSLADACIVRMAETYEHHAVFTLDSDFSIYRKHGKLALTLIHPAKD
jgi:predicted nucleic acid-binding protein